VARYATTLPYHKIDPMHGAQSACESRCTRDIDGNQNRNCHRVTSLRIAPRQLTGTLSDKTVHAEQPDLILYRHSSRSYSACAVVQRASCGYQHTVSQIAADKATRAVMGVDSNSSLQSIVSSGLIQFTRYIKEFLFFVTFYWRSTDS
jgi:hypothetical protein